MNYYIIPAALFITLIITFFFSLFTKRPLRGLWVFFLIIFLATWAGQLWITPFGPITWGIAWSPLLMVAIFFAFFVLALIPPIPINALDKKAESTAEERAFIALGTFFWIIIILLLISIAAGYYRIA